MKVICGIDLAIFSSISRKSARLCMGISLLVASGLAHASGVQPDLVQLQRQAVDEQAAAVQAEEAKGRFSRLIENTLSEDLEMIRDRLAAKGFAFQDVRPLMEAFNRRAHLRRDAFYETERTNDDGTFVSARYFLGGAEGFIAPSGIDGFYSFRANFDQPELGPDNNVSPHCQVTVAMSHGDEGYTQDEIIGKYSCQKVLYHANIDQLTADFSAWLAARLKEKRVSINDR